MLETKGAQQRQPLVLHTPGGQTMTLWEWLILYGTGVLLIILLLGHIWLVHYAVPADLGIRFSWVFQNLQLLSIQVLDLSLLFFALVHGLIGLRRVVVDLEILGRNGLRALNISLVVAGLAGMVVGIQIFQAFQTLQP